MLVRHDLYDVPNRGHSFPTETGGTRIVFVCPFLFVNIEDLKPLLDADLDNSFVTPNVLMSSFLFLDEKSRLTSPYTDPRYIPFYYYLGKYITPRTVIEVGLRLGLFSGVFFKSCKTVEHFFGFQRLTGEYYSPRLAKRNIKVNYRKSVDVYSGQIMDDEFSKKFSSYTWDLAIVNEDMPYDQHREYLDTLWTRLSLGGIIVSDYVSNGQPGGTAFIDFCKTKNRTPVRFATRYGVGMVQK
jgi:hypothetical protein